MRVMMVCLRLHSNFNTYDHFNTYNHCTVRLAHNTGQPLDKLEKVELRKQATSFVEPGFKLVMKEKVDSKLLGGFILEFEDRLVDMSVSKKLEEFNNLVSLNMYEYVECQDAHVDDQAMMSNAC